jgi:hypothetical protein
MHCPHCGFGQPLAHDFCIACGTRLPRELMPRSGPKESRWFLGVPVLPEDRVLGGLRVTRYVDEFEMESAEGSVRVPASHVRFSVWHDDAVAAAVSISDDASWDLAGFLTGANTGANTSAEEAEVPSGRTRSD